MSPEPDTTSVTGSVSWASVLDELEHDAGQPAEAVTDQAWSAPTGLGPIPRDMVGRASRLLAAQRDRIAELQAGRHSAAEHLGALRAVDATREPRGSVYLDASA